MKLDNRKTINVNEVLTNLFVARPDNYLIIIIIIINFFFLWVKI